MPDNLDQAKGGQVQYRKAVMRRATRVVRRQRRMPCGFLAARDGSRLAWPQPAFFALRDFLAILARRFAAFSTLR